MTEKHTTTDNKLDISNAAEFELFFKTHYVALCRSAFKIVSDKYAAEDVVQDVFTKLWMNRKSIEISSSLKSYLFRSVINESLTYIKKHQRVMSVDEIPQADQPESNLKPDEKQNIQELKIQLNDAINSLPPKCREVFLLSRYSEMSYKSIADQLSISIKTVENQMGKALKQIRNLMKKFLIFFL